MPKANYKDWVGKILMHKEHEDTEGLKVKVLEYIVEEGKEFLLVQPIQPNKYGNTTTPYKVLVGGVKMWFIPLGPLAEALYGNSNVKS